jgi:iron complex transport system substrate-binding protein
MTRLSKLLSSTLALLVLTGSMPALAEGLVLTDMIGREVSLAAPAQQVVVLMPGDLEIVYALGAGEKVVGRGEYCDYPEEALVLPAIQSGGETNIEQIVALRPQLIILSKMAQTPEQVTKLEQAGIAVLVTDAQSIAGVYEAIQLIGRAIGKGTEAEQLVGRMQADFAELQAKVPAGSGKTVYFESSPLQWGLWTAGQGTFMQEITEMLGLKNIFDDVAGWREVAQEKVLARDPDYIVTLAMYFGEGPTPVEEIKARAGWEKLKAVMNDAINNADADTLARPGPRLVDGAKALFDFVYSK